MLRSRLEIPGLPRALRPTRRARRVKGAYPLRYAPFAQRRSTVLGQARRPLGFLRRLLRFIPFLLLVALPGQETRAAEIDAVKELARDLVCLCGTCNRESLATCICGYAQSQRADIGTSLDAGSTKDQVIADWVSRFGQKVLATPPAQGYNLLAWIMPFALMLVGIFLLRWVLVNWRRARDRTVVDAEAPQPSLSDQHRVQLQRELDQYDEN